MTPDNADTMSVGPSELARSGEKTRTVRMAWLDALRGVAALAVCYFHISSKVLSPKAYEATTSHFNFGRFGVLLFFLISGFIIPMSLERHGSVRHFWLGRLFRMYPAYLASLALMIALIVMGLRSWPDRVANTPLISAVSHASMMPEMFGVPGVMVIYWTLGYEMVFYLITTGLFLYGLHRRSAAWAASFAVGALTLGGVLGGVPGLGQGGRNLLAVAASLAFVAVVAAWIKGGARATLAAAPVGLAFVLLIIFSGPVWAAAGKSSWEAMLAMAVMFTGTVLYRRSQQQIGKATAVGIILVVGACLAIVPAMHLYRRPGFGDSVWASLQGSWISSVVAVAFAFGCAYALRRMRTPRALVWVGKISYSVYLFHLFVMYAVQQAFPGLGEASAATRISILMAYFALILLCAATSYHLVERPGQRLGRHIERKINARWPQQSPKRFGAEQRGPADLSAQWR